MSGRWPSVNYANDQLATGTVRLCVLFAGGRMDLFFFFFFFFPSLKCACCLPLSPCLLDSDESQLSNLDVWHPIAAVCRRTTLLSRSVTEIHNFATFSFFLWVDTSSICCCPVAALFQISSISSRREPSDLDTQISAKLVLIRDVLPFLQVKNRLKLPE